MVMEVRDGDGNGVAITRASYNPDTYTYNAFLSSDSVDSGRYYIRLLNDHSGYTNTYVLYFACPGAPEPKSGWDYENGNWNYYENGYAATNDWRLDSQGWCYIGEDGKKLKNAWRWDNVGWFCLGESGHWDGVYYDAPNKA